MDDVRARIASLIREHAQCLSQDPEPAAWPLAGNLFEADELIAAVEVLLSGRMTMGARTTAFEAAWSDWLGVEGSVMVNSGSSANLLAMSALRSPGRAGGLRAGDEVLVPALTWPTAVYPVAQVGCTPVLVDVDAKTLNLEPDAVEAAITPRTRGIVVVHTLGNPCAMPRIMDIARRHELSVLEDCCEAHGARVAGQPVGTFGDLSTFSFYFSHHMTTIEGGVVCARRANGWIDDLRSRRSHGWIRERSDRKDILERLDETDDRWVFVTDGYNLRPTEINAAIGLVQLRRLPAFIRERQEIRNQLLERLADRADVIRTQQAPDGHEHSAFGLALMLCSGGRTQRDDLRTCLEQCGIETRPVVGGNLARQPAFRQLPHRIAGPLDQADAVSERGLMIGINPGVSRARIDHVVETLSNWCRTRARRLGALQSLDAAGF